MGKLLRILDGLTTFLSPIAAIFYLLCAVLLIAELSEQSSRLEVLESEGKVALATVDYLYNDGDVHVEFLDDEGGRHTAIIERNEYAEGTVSRLEIGDTLPIIYDPDFRYEPLLLEAKSEYGSNPQSIMGLLLMGGISLAILAIRPDLLFIEYVDDWNALYQRDLKKAARKASK